MRISILIVLFLVFVAGCSDDSSSSAPLPPSNLSVNIEHDANIEGKINLNITASDANYFEVDFGDGSDVITDEDGQLNYTYDESGTYLITVQAHTTPDIFISTQEQVTITIDQSINLPSNGYTTPMSYSGYSLVWNDEFEGTQLSSDWTYEIGTGSNGWGNNELQYYTSDNTTVADGVLIIEARKENVGGQNYTSSRIVTQGKQSFQYGRIDIRAVLPEGQGLWPALWMLGSNFSSVGWPYCGEIDIMEMVGGNGRENTVHGTVHWDNAGSYASYGDSFTLTSGSFQEEFHVFSIIWDQTAIKWYVDDQLYNTIDITPAELSEFQNDFFFIFNVAIGGNWPGDPNSSTQFPQRMIVDYVRVFQPN